MARRGRASAPALASVALAMALGAAAWWWLAADRPHGADAATVTAALPPSGGSAAKTGAALAGAGPAGAAPASGPAASVIGIATGAPAAPVAEPTGDLQVPAPVPLQRSARHRQGAAPVEVPPTAPAAVTDLGDGSVAFGDAAGRGGRARLGHGAVSETELGVRAPASAVPRPEDSSRVQDGNGRMLTSTAYSAEPLDRLAAFYRSQFATGGMPAREAAPAAGQWSITAGDASGQRSVLLLQDGAQVRITVTRWQAGARP